jgi:hypothetical protein
LRARPPDHLVERRREPPDLVVAPHRDGDDRLPAADLAGRGDELADRHGEPARHDDAQHERDDEPAAPKPSTARRSSR